jgi:hypothetical protein
MDGADLGDRIGGQEAEELMLALDRARLGATRALPRRPDGRKGLVRTVGALPPPLPSASLATVRRGSAAKPLAELDFGMEADDADGEDGCAPAFSGAVAWSGTPPNRQPGGALRVRGGVLYRFAVNQRKGTQRRHESAVASGSPDFWCASENKNSGIGSGASSAA